MSRHFDPRRYPDFTRRRVVDRHMAALDTHGVSRREFLALASAGAVAGATAASLGVPAVAVADQGGKMAHLIMSLRLEYSANADAGARGAAQALGLQIDRVARSWEARTQA